MSSEPLKDARFGDFVFARMHGLHGKHGAKFSWGAGIVARAPGKSGTAGWRLPGGRRFVYFFAEDQLGWCWPKDMRFYSPDFLLTLTDGMDANDSSTMAEVFRTTKAGKRKLADWNISLTEEALAPETAEEAPASDTPTPPDPTARGAGASQEDAVSTPDGGDGAPTPAANAREFVAEMQKGRRDPPVYDAARRRELAEKAEADSGRNAVGEDGAGSPMQKEGEGGAARAGAADKDNEPVREGAAVSADEGLEAETARGGSGELEKAVDSSTADTAAGERPVGLEIVADGGSGDGEGAEEQDSSDGLADKADSPTKGDGGSGSADNAKEVENAGGGQGPLAANGAKAAVSMASGSPTRRNAKNTEDTLQVAEDQVPPAASPVEDRMEPDERDVAVIAADAMDVSREDGNPPLRSVASGSAAAGDEHRGPGNREVPADNAEFEMEDEAGPSKNKSLLNGLVSKPADDHTDQEDMETDSPKPDADMTDEATKCPEGKGASYRATEHRQFPDRRAGGAESAVDAAEGSPRRRERTSDVMDSEAHAEAPRSPRNGQVPSDGEGSAAEMDDARPDARPAATRGDESAETPAGDSEVRTRDRESDCAGSKTVADRNQVAKVGAEAMMEEEDSTLDAATSGGGDAEAVDQEENEVANAGAQPELDAKAEDSPAKSATPKPADGSEEDAGDGANIRQGESDSDSAGSKSSPDRDQVALAEPMVADDHTPDKDVAAELADETAEPEEDDAAKIRERESGSDGAGSQTAPRRDPDQAAKADAELVTEVHDHTADKLAGETPEADADDIEVPKRSRASDSAGSKAVSDLDEEQVANDGAESPTETENHTHPDQPNGSAADPEKRSSSRKRKRSAATDAAEEDIDMPQPVARADSEGEGAASQEGSDRSRAAEGETDTPQSAVRADSEGEGATSHEGSDRPRKRIAMIDAAEDDFGTPQAEPAAPVDQDGEGAASQEGSDRPRGAEDDSDTPQAQPVATSDQEGEGAASQNRSDRPRKRISMTGTTENDTNMPQPVAAADQGGEVAASQEGFDRPRAAEDDETDMPQPAAPVDQEGEGATSQEPSGRPRRKRKASLRYEQFRDSLQPQASRASKAKADVDNADEITPVEKTESPVKRAAKAKADVDEADEISPVKKSAAPKIPPLVLLLPRRNTRRSKRMEKAGSSSGKAVEKKDVVMSSSDEEEEEEDHRRTKRTGKAYPGSGKVTEQQDVVMSSEDEEEEKNTRRTRRMGRAGSSSRKVAEEQDVVMSSEDDDDEEDDADEEYVEQKAPPVSLKGTKIVLRMKGTPVTRDGKAGSSSAKPVATRKSTRKESLKAKKLLKKSKRRQRRAKKESPPADSSDSEMEDTKGKTTATKNLPGRRTRLHSSRKNPFRNKATNPFQPENITDSDEEADKEANEATETTAPEPTTRQIIQDALRRLTAGGAGGNIEDPATVAAENELVNMLLSRIGNLEGRIDLMHENITGIPGLVLNGDVEGLTLRYSVENLEAAAEDFAKERQYDPAVIGRSVARLWPAPDADDVAAVEDAREQREARNAATTLIWRAYQNHVTDSAVNGI